MNPIDAIRKCQEKRIAQFAAFGVEAFAFKGVVLQGSISFTAKESEKLLRILRRLRRLEEKAKAKAK